MRIIVSVVLIISMMISSLPPLASMAEAAPINPALVELVNNATGLLYRQNNLGLLAFACTATAIEKTPRGYIFLTAAHCIGDDDTEKQRSADGKGFSFFVTFDEPVMRFYPADILGVGYQERGDDLALMHVESTETWSIVPIGDERKERMGANILNISIPMGLGKQVLFGSISQMIINRPMTQLNGINWRGAMMVQLPNITSGASGSAIVSAEQQAVVGVLVGTFGMTTIALPISRYKEFRSKLEQNQYRWFKRL